MRLTQAFISRRSGKEFLIAKENNSTTQSKYFLHPPVSMQLQSSVTKYFSNRPYFINVLVSSKKITTCSGPYEPSSG